MARSENQKLKLLLEKDYLEKYSDENHPVTVKDIITHLAEHEISAERKAIYTDLDMLEAYGLDLIRGNGKIFVAERKFELPEVKLLIDSIQTSNFITKSKSEKLINKLESLTSTYEAKALHRHVYIRNRIKNENESVYTIVDIINSAISTDRKIRFRKYTYNLNKKKEFRHGSEAYYVQSPFALVWVDQNYYMIAYDEKDNKLRHYRVDRMATVSILENEPRVGHSVFNQADMSTYTRKVFNMFGGNIRTVKLRFSNFLLDAVLDRFGNDIIVIPDGDSHFTVNVDVAVSQMFYAWLFGFKGDAEVIFPQDVRDGMKAQLETVMANYNK